MKRESQVQEWIGVGFKYLATGVIALGIFVFQNTNKNVEQSFASLNKNMEQSIATLNDTLKGLTAQLKAMEDRQVKTEKELSAIQVAREINGAAFQKSLVDVADLKNKVGQQDMRLQTISDVIANVIMKKK